MEAKVTRAFAHANTGVVYAAGDQFQGTERQALELAEWGFVEIVEPGEETGGQAAEPGEETGGQAAEPGEEAEGQAAEPGEETGGQAAEACEQEKKPTARKRAAKPKGE